MPTEGDGAAPTRRVALGLEYDGSAYSGWQRQSHAPSVQDALQQAIAGVADHPVRVAAAGRTDAGVHALNQVVHFDTTARRSLYSWQRGINSHLPSSACVTWVREVPENFHARYSALSRRYCYLVLNRPARPALARDRALWVIPPLDVDAMQASARPLLGEHDFSAFRASACQARSPVRRLLRLDVARESDRIVFHCEANGFLHHMVRNLVGALLRVGVGDAPREWPAAVLGGRDRRLGAPTAPPQGLYLAAVAYPASFSIPAAPPSPFWHDRG